jgi:hypothetical protein
MPDHNDKQSNSGFLILIFAVLLLGIFGIFFIDPPVFVLVLGLVGFACGAAISF